MGDQSEIKVFLGSVEEYQKYCLRILKGINFMEKENGREMDS